MASFGFPTALVMILDGLIHQEPTGPPWNEGSLQASNRSGEINKIPQKQLDLISCDFYTSPIHIPSRMQYGFLLRYGTVEDTVGIGTGRR